MQQKALQSIKEQERLVIEAAAAATRTEAMTKAGQAAAKRAAEAGASTTDEKLSGSKRPAEGLQASPARRVPYSWQVFELELPPGATYRGQIGSNRPHGAGTLRYADGSSYTGEFIDGCREGQGRWQDAPDYEGNVWLRYEGEWKADKRHGHGKETLVDPDVGPEVKEGLWENDQYIDDRDETEHIDDCDAE